MNTGDKEGRREDTVKDIKGRKEEETERRGKEENVKGRENGEEGHEEGDEGKHQDGG